MREVGDRIKVLDAELKTLEAKSEALAAWIPNLPHPSVPPGKDAAQNQVVRSAGTPRTFAFEPRATRYRNPSPTDDCTTQ